MEHPAVVWDQWREARRLSRYFEIQQPEVYGYVPFRTSLGKVGFSAGLGQHAASRRAQVQLAGR